MIKTFNQSLKLLSKANKFCGRIHLIRDNCIINLISVHFDFSKRNPEWDIIGIKSRGVQFFDN
jgi:hypothetical protein